MKYMTSVLAILVLFSASAFAATEITKDDNYIKLGTLNFDQPGAFEIGGSIFKKEVDKKCKEFNTPADQCYYRIIDIAGDKSNHKHIDAVIYKAK